MSDKRTVTTDALETLGTIIDDKQKRDAIHIAVEPVVADEWLSAGDHVVVSNGRATKVGVGDGMGIVDPFIVGIIRPGDRFWFLMYPRQVTSLRHVWAHPAFPDEVGTPRVVGLTTDEVSKRDAGLKAASESWLRDFCGRSDCPSYETVMELVGTGRVADPDIQGSYADSEYLHFDSTDAHGEIPPEFWHHAEIVLGRKLEHHPTYFSCSC